MPDLTELMAELRVAALKGDYRAFWPIAESIKEKMTAYVEKQRGVMCAVALTNARAATRPVEGGK